MTTQFPQNRTVRFVGTLEKPEWIAQDVCHFLELPNVSRALSSLNKTEKGIIYRNSTIWQQLAVSNPPKSMLTVFEPGLYRLILKSRKPAAKPFKQWAHNQILRAVSQNTYPRQKPTPRKITPSEVEPSEDFQTLFDHTAEYLRTYEPHKIPMLEEFHFKMHAKYDPRTVMVRVKATPSTSCSQIVLLR